MNGIAGFFLVVAFIVLACAATSVLSIALVFRRLNHANRVSPSVPTPAPLSWLWSFRTAARMHRRLRAGIATARAAVAVQGAVGLGLDDVVAELEARACQLDGQLVVADRAPQRPRLRMLRELAAEARELESLVERVVRMSRAWSGASPSERGLAPVRERLELLEQALRELDGIEQPWHLPLPGRPPARELRHHRGV